MKTMNGEEPSARTTNVRRRRRRLAWLLCLAVGALSSGCRSAGGVSCLTVGPGPEDFELDASPPDGPRLIVSSAHRGLFSRGGALKAVPLDGDGALGSPRTLTIVNGPSKLHPVGISLVPAHDDQPALLYVIDKGRPHRILKLEVRGDELRLAATLVSPLLREPNDLVATKEGHVYVSNVSARRGLTRLIGMLRRRPLGNVVYFDGKKWDVGSARTIAFPNGMAVSEDGERLFVAAFLESAILVFERHPDSGRLFSGMLETIGLAAHPDNLTWVEGKPGTGELVVAGHGSVGRTTLHLYLSPSLPAPSAVILVDTNASRATTTPLFADNGREVSASSTALLWRDRLYVSQLRRPQICVKGR